MVITVMMIYYDELGGIEFRRYLQEYLPMDLKSPIIYGEVRPNRTLFEIMFNEFRDFLNHYSHANQNDMTVFNSGPDDML